MNLSREGSRFRTARHCSAVFTLALLGSACSTGRVPSALSERPLVIPGGSTQFALALGAGHQLRSQIGRFSLVPPARDLEFAGVGGLRFGLGNGLDLQLPLYLGYEVFRAEAVEVALRAGISEAGFGYYSAGWATTFSPSIGASVKLGLDHDTALFMGAGLAFRLQFTPTMEGHGPLIASFHPTFVHELSEEVSVALSAGLIGVIDPEYVDELHLRIGGFGSDVGSPVPMFALHLSPSWDLIAGVGADISLLDDRTGVYGVAGFEWHSDGED